MQADRIIGRILSLGFPLAGPRVDNYSILSAPSFFDYDALVVDPSAASSLIDGVAAGALEVQAFSGAPVHNDIAGPPESRLAALLERRRDEAAALLSRGGLIVCFAHPPHAHAAIAGLQAFDDYAWLPEELAQACRAPRMQPADGTEIQVVDHRHPFAAFLVGQLANIAFRAHFPDAPASAVFARSRGGAAVAIEPVCERGRLVLLPALRAVPSGDARYALSEALQAAIRRARGVMAEGREPPWARLATLPGLDARADALHASEQALIEAQGRRDEAARAYEELARYRRLLWQEGELGLCDVVLDALRRIGFEVYAQDPAAIELRHDGTPVLLEIEAAEREVELGAHYRLRQRIEQAMERRGEAPRGLLIVNGRRLEAPEQRDAQVSDALRLAAETMRYGIATSASLFDALAAKLAGDDNAVSAYCCRLLGEDGLIT